jgi:hypothetical protein
MAKKSVFREENFIPGVFNYCNAWCERCPFRLRCRNYAMAADEDGNPIDYSIEGGREKIEENLRKAFEMPETEDQERDLDPDELMNVEEPDPEEMKEWEEEEEREQMAAREHPLHTITMEYSDRSREWLDANEERIDKRLRVLQSSLDSHNDGSRLANASEVVHWYVFMIHVKSHRALRGISDMHAEHWGTPVQSDANGSAKVALLGAEESLSAWIDFAETLPDSREELMPLISMLRRIIRMIERVFPDVRKFVRAGFDDGQ